MALWKFMVYEHCELEGLCISCYVPVHFRNLWFYRVTFCLFRYLIPLLLQYDSTAEESDKRDAHGVGISVQIAKNIHAVKASHALSRLSGLVDEEIPTPYNQAAADALRALLTPKLASMLKNKLAKDLLFTLNSNLESPEIIWNSST
ncbi:dnaJ homolog subfamily C GRV2-like [Sesamum indicum]|uniref:DnaJ homolog subfamily C GRV2-like n=1 Tax=Sesamum indicum TaxID=4182 RepID=A0A6I9UR65_SESIN|nr:dnaJ homolog subfamily C GRV2-like [Sesamum indicum]